MSARDTSGSAPQHSHPHNNTMSRNEKFWVDQVTVPHPPLGNDKGWGTTRGGGGESLVAVDSTINIGAWAWTEGWIPDPGLIRKTLHKTWLWLDFEALTLSLVYLTVAEVLVSDHTGIRICKFLPNISLMHLNNGMISDTREWRLR